MTYMLCRHKVADYDHWKLIFDSNSLAQQNAGLKVELHWRGIEDPNEVFILFAVDDIERAKTFVTPPEPTDARQKPGLFNKPVVYFIKDDFQ